MVSRRQDIEIELDPETNNYFIIWEPKIISLGQTPEGALSDLREAAHQGVDVLINLKLQSLQKAKEA
jgi:predicted RNase H-like HicB family nuclease